MMSKFIILFSFILNNILFMNIAFAQAEQSKEEQKKEKFKEEAKSIYQALNITSIVPFEAFFTGYTGYFEHKKKLSNLPIITFINYSMPSNKERMVTIDFQARRVLFLTHAAHGINSSARAQGSSDECEKTTTQDDPGGSPQPACDKNIVVTLPGVSFSNVGGSFKSKIGLHYFGSPNTRTNGDASLLVHGLEPGKNDNDRSILYHQSGYAEQGYASQGCIAVPNSKFRQGYELLKNNTLFYSFEGSKMTSTPGDAPVTEDISNEALAESEKQNFSSTPDVSNIKPDKPEFEDLEIAKSSPSKGALAMGLVGVGAAYALTTSNDKKSKDSAMATIPLQGSAHYEKCQKLSNSSWAETSTGINSGVNPSEYFTGSWRELNQNFKENSVENGEAVEMANERVAEINDCVATAYISPRTDFTKPNINQPEKKSSSDGSITCVYEGPESQDYQPCLDTIAEYDGLRANEEVAHNQQAKDFQSTTNESLKQVSGENAQAESLKQFTNLQSEHSSIALKRADISSNNINSLAAIASKIPTIDKLYDECKQNYAKHGTVSINEYNQFAKVYLGKPKTFSAERDYCLQAISSGTKPIQNQNAREQIKKVLKKLGHEMEEYTSKSQALKNRTTQTPGFDNSSFTRNLTDLKFNNTDNSAPMGGYGRDGSMLMQSNGLGNSGGAGGFNFNGSLNGQNANNNSEVAGINKGSSGANRANIYSTSGGSGSIGNQGLNGTAGAGRVAGNGIYDEEFYSKINAALQAPEKLSELKLSPDQMKEYIARKEYNQLMAQGSSKNTRAPASSAGDVKDERPLDISAKEMNIFDIISTRYAKEFSNDL